MDRFVEVETVEDAVDQLSDRAIAFAYIALAETPDLQRYTDRGRQGLFTHRYSGALSLQDMASMDEQEASLMPLRAQESREYSDIFTLKADPDFKVQTRSGHMTSVAPEISEWGIGMCAIQVDHQQAQAPSGHADNSGLTVNFYAAGRGIKYALRTDDPAKPQWIAMKSPIITVHRGEAHPLGPEGAVYHKGQAQVQGQPRLNFFYTLTSHRRVGEMVKTEALRF